MKASPPLALPFAAATVVGSVMIAVSVLVLPGETGGRRATTPPSTPPSAVSAVSAAPDRLASLPPGVELIVASGPDLSQGARRKAIDAWNQLHPGIQARIVAVEGNTDRQRDRFHALLDPANADVVDIVNVDSVHLPEFANTSSTGATGLLAPIGAGDTDVVGAITEDHLRDFLPNALLTCYWQEKLYGLPFNTDVGLLFFHAGTAPAPSWNELPGALAKNPAVPARLALQLGRDEAFVVNVLEQLLAVNGNLLNADGTPPTVVQDEWEKALEPLRRAVRDGVVYFPEDPKGATAEEDSSLAFEAKEAAAMRNWPVWFRTIQPQPAVRKLFGPGVLGGQNLAVAAKSRYKSQAIELIKFLTSAENQQRLLVDGRFVPTRESTYKAVEVRAKVPYIDVLHSAVKEARPRPISPNYYRVSSVILENLRPAVLTGARVPDTFERNLQDALD